MLSTVLGFGLKILYLRGAPSPTYVLCATVRRWTIRRIGGMGPISLRAWAESFSSATCPEIEPRLWVHFSRPHDRPTDCFRLWFQKLETLRFDLLVLIRDLINMRCRTIIALLLALGAVEASNSQSRGLQGGGGGGPGGDGAGTRMAVVLSCTCSFLPRLTSFCAATFDFRI